MIRLFVCDLDGTLLNSRQELSLLNADALKKAIRNGNRVMVATGRSLSLVRPFFEKYDLRCGGVLLNGAEVRDEDERIIATTNIENSCIPELHKFLVQHDYMPFYTTDSCVFYQGDQIDFEQAIENRQICLSRAERISHEEARKEGLKSSYALDAQKIKDIEQLCDDRVEIRKVVVFNPDSEKNQQVAKEINEVFTRLSAAGSYPENIEINDRCAQKGYGLEKAIKNMGLSKDEVAVFGDGLNDLSMFEVFPNSYAVANAVDEIKDCAKYIVRSNDEDGVGKTILRIMLEEESV